MPEHHWPIHPETPVFGIPMEASPKIGATAVTTFHSTAETYVF